MIWQNQAIDKNQESKVKKYKKAGLLKCRLFYLPGPKVANKLIFISCSDFVFTLVLGIN
jgi:hypothetical protein